MRTWWRGGTAGIAVLLVACSPPATVDLDASEAMTTEDDEAGEVLVMMLTELNNHFSTHDDAPTQIISDDATARVAAQELSEELDLGSQARDFAIATGVELQRQAAEATPLGDVTGLEVDALEADTFRADDETIYAVTVQEEWHRSSGPITQTQTQYALDWQDHLDGVEAVLGTATFSLDNAADLTTPQGAVQRYVDLIGDRDYDAIARLSDGQNVNEAALDVLHSLMAAAEDYRMITLPQAREDQTDTVYAIASDGTPLARFQVTVGSLIPAVVYFPTS